MVKSLIVAGTVIPPFSAANVTQYWPIVGFLDDSTDENLARRRIHEAGVLSNLQITLDSNSVNNTIVFTLRKNGADGNQTLSFPSTTSGTIEDTSGTDTIASGDYLAIKSVPAGGSTGTFGLVYNCMVFTPTDTNTCVSLTSNYEPGGQAGFTGASTRYYQGYTGWFAGPQTTESVAQYKEQISGTWKNLTSRVASNARTTTTTFEFRKGGVSQSLINAYTSTQTGDKADTTNSVAVVDNDLTNWDIINSTGTAAISWNYQCAEFRTSGSPAQCVFFAYYQGTVSQARDTIRYFGFTGIPDQITTEAITKFKVPVDGFTAKNLSVNISQNSISAETSHFILRKNGVDTALDIPIVNGATGWLEDVTNSVTIAEGDDLDFAMVLQGSGSQTTTLRGYAIHLEAANPTASGDMTNVSSINLTNQFIIKA